MPVKLGRQWDRSAPQTSDRSEEAASTFVPNQFDRFGQITTPNPFGVTSFIPCCCCALGKSVS